MPSEKRRTGGAPGQDARRAVDPGHWPVTDSPDPSGVGEHMPALAPRAKAQGSPAVLVRDGDCARTFTVRPPCILHIPAGIGWQGHGPVAAAAAVGATVLRTQHPAMVLTDPRQMDEHARRADLLHGHIAVSAEAAAGWRRALSRPVACAPKGIAMRPLPRRVGAGVLTVAGFTHQKRHAKREDRRGGHGVDPILGIFVARMGPIAASSILHADAEQFGASAPFLGAGVEGRPVLVRAGATSALFCALFARRGGASEVVVVGPCGLRQDIARRMGFLAMGEDEAGGYAKSAWHHRIGGRRAEYVFQTRARPDSLNRALQALRPQGTVIGLALYQGGMDATRLGEEFRHNGLSIRCARINRMPRPPAHVRDQRRLTQEAIRLLADQGPLIRAREITPVMRYDDAPDFPRHLLHARPEFLQILFDAT